MKNSISLRAAAFIIALVLAVGVLAGCSKTGNGDGTSDTGSPSATTAPEETTAPADTTPTALSVLGEKDFGGDTVTFYSRYYNGIWRSDLMATEDDTDTLKVAVYRRNKFIEEAYKVKIDEMQSGSASFRSKLENLVMTGDESFDAVYMSVTDAAESAQAGLFWDLHDIGRIDLEGKWWSQSCNKAWSIAGRQFFAVGDITTIDNMATYCTFFNRKIVEANQLVSPYDLVKSNEWTLGKMFEMIESAYVPGQSDNEAQVYGLSAENSFGFMMLMASGELISRNDENDIPQITIGNERSLSIADMLVSKTAGNKAIYLGADTAIMNNFRNSQSLFMPEVLYHLITLRDSDLDVGVVPLPKYDPEQDSYYSFTTGYCITCLGFPQSNTGDRLERAAFITEAMAVQSLTTVTPAYFEVCVKTRYAPDIESSGMIQIILDTIYTDLAEVYKWGGLRDKVQKAVKEGGSITTIVNASKKSADIARKLTVSGWEKVKKLG